MANEQTEMEVYTFFNDPPGNFPLPFVVQRMILKGGKTRMDDTFLLLSSDRQAVFTTMEKGLGLVFFLGTMGRIDCVLGTFVHKEQADSIAHILLSLSNSLNS